MQETEAKKLRRNKTQRPETEDRSTGCCNIMWKCLGVGRGLRDGGLPMTI